MTNKAIVMNGPASEATSAKKVSDLVKAAIKSYGTAQSKVQEAALAIMAHAKTYGDCSQARFLCRGVPARERNSLIGWFALYSPIGVSLGKTSADDKARFIRAESKNYHDFNLVAAKANNWWDDPAQVNQEPKPLNTIIDFYQTIDRMLKNAIRDAEKDNRYDPLQKDEIKKQANDILTQVNKYRSKHLADAMKVKETVGLHEEEAA